VSRWEAEIAAEIEAAITTAEEADLEPVADLTRYVTSPADSDGGTT
jgi:pyruvate dehydrogenase E1 component alpha subunit